MKILNYFLRVFIGVTVMLSIACNGGNDSSNNSNDSLNEEELVFKDGEPTITEGNLPNQMIFYILSRLDEMAPLELSPSKFSIIESEQKGFYNFVWEGSGVKDVQFIQQIRETEKGRTFALRTKRKDKIFNYELKKSNEPGRWTIDFVDDAGGQELVDMTWVSKWAESNNYSMIKDIWKNAKNGQEIMNQFEKKEMKWKELVEYEGNQVLLTDCDVDPAELKFTYSDHYSEDYIKIHKIGQEEELTIQKVISEDYWIYFFCQDGEHMGAGNTAEIMLFFKHYSVKIGKTEFHWEELIFKEDFKKERVFVSYDALDRYDIKKIPCKGQNESYPDLDKLLNQKWVMVDENNHNKVIDSEEKVLVEKKNGYYFFDGEKICLMEDGIYIIDCEETRGCFDLAVYDDILHYRSRPWCANDNNSESTYYKKAESGSN